VFPATGLSLHYGFTHGVVFSLMQNELGDTWRMGDSLEADLGVCRVCAEVVDAGLADHHCSPQQLPEGLPTTPPFRCPSCHASCPTHLALMKHVGKKHGLLQKLLTGEGKASLEELNKRSSKSRYYVIFLRTIVTNLCI
jgi:uncharacterized C2H2 Zn-finger protein